MDPRIQLDLFETWLPRRPALLAALGIWVAGFATAGATAWRMHHQTVADGEVAVTPTEAVGDTADVERAVFMPEDVVVGVKTPRMGVTLTQKP
jgi:hypothetical protein